MKRKSVGLLITGVVLCSVLCSTVLQGGSDLLAIDPASPPGRAPDTPAAAGELQGSFTGAGANRTVRTYLDNSSSVENASGDLVVDSPSDDARLTHANMDFLLQRNYTTNYTIEDDNPLDLPLNVSQASWYNISTTGDWAPNGTLVGSDPLVQDAFALGTHVNVTSVNVTSHVIANLTVVANFSEVVLDDDVFPLEATPYDFRESLALNFSIFVGTNLTETCWTNLSVWDWVNETWAPLAMTEVNVTGSEISAFFVNNNSRFVGPDEYAIFHLNVTNRTNTGFFNVSVFDVNTSATVVNQIVFGGSTWAAMEFDLKGDVDLHGFWAWIRPVNVSYDSTVNLTISLYEANHTGNRDDMTSIGIIYTFPNWTKLKYQYNVTNYTTDAYAYFPLPTWLNLSNYFIVLNSSDPVNIAPRYRLVVIPQYGNRETIFGDEDEQIDHLLIETSNMGQTWSRIFLDLDNPCDAAPFVLNVTRRWLPGEINLTVQDRPVQGHIVNTGPYAETTPLEWGLGRWINYTSPVIENDGDNFTIPVAWDADETIGLLFNCSYAIQTYSIENATTTYTYNTQSISWKVNYTLQLSSYSTVNWTYREFWYLLPKDWTTSQLLTPLGVMDSLTAEPNNLTAYQNYIVRYAMDGEYQLTCQGYNYIFNTTSAINFNGTSQWPTTNFMVGDNISAMTGVQDRRGREVFNGYSNCSLYDNAGNFIAGSTRLYDAEIDKVHAGVALYKFENENVFAINNTVAQGMYWLLFHWNNGSEIGCANHSLTITRYDLNIMSVQKNPSNPASNVMRGTINKNFVTTGSYSLFTFSGVAPTASTSPSEMGITRTSTTENISNIIIKSFSQNETYLNPGETIKFNFTLQNGNLYLAKTVKVFVDLVYVAKPEWKLLTEESQSVTLNYYGTPTDEQEFNFEATIPIDHGENCPLRFSALKTVITLYEGSDELGQYTVTDDSETVELSLFANNTEAVFDGYLLKEHYFQGMSGVTFFSDFERGTECIVPGSTSYFAVVMDGSGMCMTNIAAQAFSAEIQPEITGLTLDRTAIDWNNLFTVSGTVQTELDEPIPSIVLNLTRYNQATGLYEAFTAAGAPQTVTANAAGAFSVILNASHFFNGQANYLGFAWAGVPGTYSALQQNYSLPIRGYTSAVQLTVLNPGAISGNSENLLRVRVTNVGNSTLTNVSITGAQLGDANEYALTELQIDYSETDSLLPQESFDVTYQTHIPRLDAVQEKNFSARVQAVVFETHETYTARHVLPVTINQGPFLGETPYLGVVLVFVGIGIAWALLAFALYRGHQARARALEDNLAKREKPRKGPAGKGRKGKGKPKPPADEADKPKKPVVEKSLDDLLEENKDNTGTGTGKKKSKS